MGRFGHIALSLSIALAGTLFAQSGGDSATGSEQLVQGSCDAASRAAKDVLGRHGMRIVSEVHCGEGSVCMVTGNAQPQRADGTKISRKEVVERYLKEPAKADIRKKKEGGGYWEMPDRNFVMGGSLNLRDEQGRCSVTFRLGFSIRYTQFLVIFPFELYGDDFQSNGILEREYLQLIARELGAN